MRATAKIEVRRLIWCATLAPLLLALCSVAWADDFAAVCADRAAIERVYYSHRLGQKPPFEETLPPATLQSLVRQDLKKETVLQKTYGVAITRAMLAAEVQRINTTSRAPDILAEIKAALGNDTNRFALTVAKPILVERLLREHFENDEALHAGTRRACEAVRKDLLAARTNGASVTQLVALLKRADSNAVMETTWQLTPRPATTNAPAADELEIKKRFGPGAQIISPPREVERGLYFEELPSALQNVLRVQLRRPGDVSAVIETPTGFLLYLAKERTEAVLSVAGLVSPKRSYEQWLEEQQENKP